MATPLPSLPTNGTAVSSSEESPRRGGPLSGSVLERQKNGNNKDNRPQRVDKEQRRRRQRRRGRRRTADQEHRRAKEAGLVMLLLSVLYLYFLWRTQRFLDDIEARNSQPASQHLTFIPSSKRRPNQEHHRSQKRQNRSFTRRQGSAAGAQAVAAANSFSQSAAEPVVQVDSAQQQKVDDGLRYLIFVPISSGQGTGNIVSGLLAVHLLALEFDRIVCVDPKYKSFHAAFEAINPDSLQHCPSVLANETTAASDDEDDVPIRRTSRDYIRIVNFEQAPDECALKAKLASSQPVWFIECNTYPRWPVVPDNFFFTHYQAKPELLKMLPYYDATQKKGLEHPEIVVHLRAPDGHGDPRKGLDDKSLLALGDYVRREHPNAVVYLVTNRVEWYELFETDFGWRHPKWNEVVHSAFDRSWGMRHAMQKTADTKAQHVAAAEVDRDLQNLQMWADWYTLLRARFVYHTHSDFSISAIHWQNIPSRTILGWNAFKQELELEEESWRVTGETERLVDRTVGGPGTSELRKCSKNSQRAQGLFFVKGNNGGQVPIFGSAAHSGESSGESVRDHISS